jgi:aliphatic sulfonates family ABC transporter substrate-binding protein
VSRQAHAFARLRAHTIAAPRFAILTLVLTLALGGAAHPQMRVGWQTGDVNTEFTFAVATKKFEDQGLRLELKPFPAGPAMLPALAAGEIDVAWLGEFPAVTGFANGLPLEVFMVQHMHRAHIRLVARPDVGIKTLLDLKGKKIGVSIGSTGHFHLLRALAMAGLSQQDVTLINLAPANMPPAYVAGQIDAALTWEPNIGEMEARGAVRLATTESLGLITGIVGVARKSYLAEHPNDIQKFLKAWDAAITAYRKTPAEVMRYEAQRLGQSPSDFARLVERQKLIVPSMQEQLTAEYLGRPGEQANSRMLTYMRDIARFLLTIDRIKAEPTDWSGLIDIRPLVAYAQNPR